MFEKGKDADKGIKLPLGIKYVCQEIVTALETVRYGTIKIIIIDGRMERFVVEKSELIPQE